MQENEEEEEELEDNLTPEELFEEAGSNMIAMTQSILDVMNYLYHKTEELEETLKKETENMKERLKKIQSKIEILEIDLEFHDGGKI